MPDETIKGDLEPMADRGFAGPTNASDNAWQVAQPVDVEAADPASQAKEQGASLVGQVKDQAVAAVSTQKDGLADRIDQLADTVHESGAQFAGKQDWIASAVERGATELGSLATALRDNDLSSLVTQIRAIARKQPALFIGASLAAGFAVARLGKLVVADISGDDLPVLPEVGHGRQ